MPLRFRILPPEDAGRPAGTGATGRLPARDVEVSDDHGEIRLGSGADVELPLPFAVVSEVHARLVRATSPTPPHDLGWFVEDLGGTSGTWLDGLRLAPGERRPLAPGGELRLGAVRLVLLAPDGARSTVEGTGTIARRLVDDLFGGSAAGTPTLRVTGGAPPRALVLAVAGHPYIVGRAETCALCLPVEEVSREHAAFIRGAEGVVVRNLGAKNGVLVNGARISDEHPLGDADVVEIGPVVLTLDDPAARYLRDLANLPPEPAPVAESEVPAPVPSPVPLEPPPPPAVPATFGTRLATVVAIATLAFLILAAVALSWPTR